MTKLFPNRRSEPFRVLIVEDDFEQAELMAEFLHLSGPFKVQRVDRIASLWSTLESSRPDIILMDYRLPDGTGMEALAELPRRSYDIPVVMITGQGDERSAVQAMRLGAVDYLVKGSDFMPNLPALIQKAIWAHELQLKVQRSLEQVRYQALLLNNVRDAVVVWNTEGRITYWNPAAESLYGRAAKECLDQPVKESYLDTFNPPVREPPREGTSGQEIERWYRGKKGEVIWVSSRVTALRDYGADGRLIGYMDVARDITGRKLAEDALRAERNFVSAVLDTVGALVVVTDTEGRIVRFNRACEAITGYSFEEVRGKKITELFILPEELEAVQEAFDRISAGRYPDETEYHWLTRSGERRLIAWKNTALTGARGAVNYIIATGLDITESRAMEAQIVAAQTRLAQSSRLAAVGELASGVAHHINNPLTTIIAEAQLLLHNLPAAHPARESAEAIEQAGWRVQKAVQQLLDFSRPPSDTLESLGVNDTIQAALDLVSGHIQSTGVSLEVELAEALPQVRGCAQQLSNLWVNLLMLAHDATSDGSPHTIRVCSRDGNGSEVTVEVYDDGAPIPPEDLAALFELNFIKPVGGRGTGIELNLCQEIVRQHQGSISVESLPKRGTVFRVSLPAEVEA